MRATAISAVLAALSTTAGCVANPRNEIPAIVDAAVARYAASARAPLCVERAIVPWRPPAGMRQTDPTPPPGFAGLLTQGVFRGGGGIKADRIGRATIGAGAGCAELHGPLIAGDRALVEVHRPGISWSLWLRRNAGRWRVMAMTTSEHPV